MGGQTHSLVSSPPGKRLGTVFKAGWTPGTALRDAIKFASVCIRSPDRPTLSAVAIPTMLTHIYSPTYIYIYIYIFFTLCSFGEFCS